MSIAENFLGIKKQIAGRARLIAVSKTIPAEKIAEALETGHRLFGENRVQEAQVHWAKHRKNIKDLELHLIGPLQTNKVKDAVALFDVIETLDRKNLVEALAKEETKQGKRLTYFIQVNTGNEAQKTGISLENFSGLLEYAKAKNLNINGLMCIPPVDQDPVPHFEILKKLASRNHLKELSMGMSGDFKTAIEHGATYVRIGTALFGTR